VRCDLQRFRGDDVVTQLQKVKVLFDHVVALAFCCGLPAYNPTAIPAKRLQTFGLYWASCAYCLRLPLFPVPVVSCFWVEQVGVHPTARSVFTPVGLCVAVLNDDCEVVDHLSPHR
jgi:hypothetical protein